MTDLERIRGELQRTPAYDPAKPIKKALLEQIANDLAFYFGTDTAYVMELFEQIASDTGIDHDPGAVTPEMILKTLFEVLAPYQNKKAMHPPPIEYVGVYLPPIDGVQVNDLIASFAISECGWPQATTCGMGSRFELTYQEKDRRAYVLEGGPYTYLVPRYDEALSMHIEKRDAAYGLEPEQDDEDDDPFRALTNVNPPFGPGIGYRCRSFISPSLVKTMAAFGGRSIPRIPAPTYSKRYHTIVVDEAIEEDKTSITAMERDRIVATWFTEELGQRIKKAFEKVAQDETVVIDSLAKVQAELKAMVDDLDDDEGPVLKPVAAPVRPARPLRLPGHPRSPERRSRAPPGAGNGASIGTMGGPAGQNPRASSFLGI